MSILAHADDPIVRPVEPGQRANLLEGFEVGDQVGNPLYGVVDEHVLAVIVLIAAPLLVWIGGWVVRMLAQAGSSHAQRVLDRHRGADLRLRIASWAIAISALIHAILVFTHEPTLYTVLYAGGAVALAWASWAVLGTRRRTAAAVVVASVVTFWFLGAPADQLGVATKLLELFALVLLAYPAEQGDSRRFRVAGTVSLVVLTGVAAWIGAFATVGADGGHHGGEYPEPGTLVPYIDRLEPTADEAHFATDLYWETYAAIDRYRDVAVAEAAGYEVGVVRGTDHHAQNPSFIGDGRILDPEYPESLIYAESPGGPVLIGVMFETDGIGQAGPTDGGPIMLWHSHENICISVIPFGLAGLESPFGSCPVGALNLPITGEMLHAWMIPGIPDEDKWGHVDDGFVESYLEGLSRASG
ncbi:MAG: hypothetical protein QNJ71_08415 [Acidimicrobiia bacterium]|nr:hypothetical protein [Acidimicrobiia bacterium]